VFLHFSRAKVIKKKEQISRTQFTIYIPLFIASSLLMAIIAIKEKTLLLAHEICLP
jgi:hypothetical protein